MLVRREESPKTPLCQFLLARLNFLPPKSRPLRQKIGEITSDLSGQLLKQKRVLHGEKVSLKAPSNMSNPFFTLSFLVHPIS
jgi:hypothetical protein